MKNYLIIGGSSGIGKEVVALLSSEDCKIYSTYHSTIIHSSRDNVQYFPIDVTEDFTLDFLPKSLDGIVYCPGTIELLPISRLKPDKVQADFNLQVLGALKTVQKTLPLLKKSESASIVFFSTIAVQNGFPFHAQISISKGAIEGLTKSLAAELSPNIRVNAIAPALVDTPLASKLLNTEKKKEFNAQMNPMKRVGQVEDIANMVVFLLSEKSSWITGQVLHVDGGMSTIKK